VALGLILQPAKYFKENSMEDKQIACPGICPHCDILGCAFRQHEALPMSEVLDVVVDRMLEDMEGIL
jgi:hypothetical protein